MINCHLIAGAVEHGTWATEIEIESHSDMDRDIDREGDRVEIKIEMEINTNIDSDRDHAIYTSILYCVSPFQF